MYITEFWLNNDLWTAITASFLIWLSSSISSILIGLILVIAKNSEIHFIKKLSNFIIDLTRGIPTGFIVIGFGLGALRYLEFRELSSVFIGTLPSFQQMAWALVIALALGSSGHIAEIMHAAYSTLHPSLLEQTKILSLSLYSQILLIGREVLLPVLAPLGSRLVHHLHNTAFVSLFPVIDLFGYVKTQSNLSFRINEFVLLGSVIYILLSICIWSVFWSIEMYCTNKSYR